MKICTLSNPNGIPSLSPRVVAQQRDYPGSRRKNVTTLKGLHPPASIFHPLKFASVQRSATAALCPPRLCVSAVKICTLSNPNGIPSLSPRVVAQQRDYPGSPSEECRNPESGCIHRPAIFTRSNASARRSATSTLCPPRLCVTAVKIRASSNPNGIPSLSPRVVAQQRDYPGSPSEECRNPESGCIHRPAIFTRSNPPRSATSAMSC